MSNRIVRRRQFTRKLALAVALTTAIAVGVLDEPTIRAQSTPALPKFEVASIKLSTSGVRRQNVRPLPGGLHTESASVRLLMEIAYDLQEFQVAGGPSWIDSDGYNIDAKAEGAANKSQVWLMLQSLLEDRFHLRAHRETKERPSYTLIATKGGPKLPSPKNGGCWNYSAGPPSEPRTAPAQSPPPCGHPMGLVLASGVVVQGGDLPITEFIKLLSEIVGRPVIDKTGVIENFDVHLEFLPDDATPGIHSLRRAGNPDGPSDPVGKPSIMMALQEQLGLKLESTKGPVEILVIDHVERPSEN